MSNRAKEQLPCADCKFEKANALSCYSETLAFSFNKLKLEVSLLRPFANYDFTCPDFEPVNKEDSK